MEFKGLKEKYSDKVVTFEEFEEIEEEEEVREDENLGASGFHPLATWWAIKDGQGQEFFYIY